MSVQTAALPQLTTPILTGRTADMLLAVFVVAWTAEAMGQLPLPAIAVTLLIYASFCARFAFFGPDLLVQALKRTWLLPFPILCLLSTLWSPAPQATFISALQLGFTLCAGLYLGLRFSVSQLALLACLGLGAGIVASAFIWPLQLDSSFAAGGGYQGVFLQKNGLGQRAAMFLILAMIVLSTARGWHVLALLAGIAVAVLMLILSQSVTSQIMAVGALMAGFFWQAAAQSGVARALATIVALTAIGAIFAVLLILQINPINVVLTYFEKAPDLTGRLVLWDVAQARAGEAPVLGHGYMAYWKASDFAHEVSVLRAVHGPTVGAFHNFGLDVLVGTGAAGAVAMGLFLAGLLWTLAMSPADGTRGWCLVFFAVAIVLSLLGSSLYRPHEVVVLLLVAVAVARSRAGAVPLP